MCRASTPRYFYNIETGCCEGFLYGGCKGNGNRYTDLDECRRKCETSADGRATVKNCPVPEQPFPLKD